MGGEVSERLAVIAKGLHTAIIVLFVSAAVILVVFVIRTYINRKGR